MSPRAALRRVRHLQPGCSAYYERGRAFVQLHHEAAGGWRIATTRGDDQTCAGGLTDTEAARLLLRIADGGRLVERLGVVEAVEVDGNRRTA